LENILDAFGSFILHSVMVAKAQAKTNTQPIHCFFQRTHMVGPTPAHHPLLLHQGVTISPANPIFGKGIRGHHCQQLWRIKIKAQ
jgi:hypothetical protein